MGQIFAYARVSTDAQDLDPQTDELRKDGFDVLIVEKGVWRQPDPARA
jgi:DNA invertase Pin-like site-specific DNA recombinase